MKKTMLAAILMSVAQSAQAGQFVQKSLYVPIDVAVGKAKTLEAARRDAEGAIPKGASVSSNEEGESNKPTADSYEADAANNSTQYQCENNKRWTESTECGGGHYRCG